MSAPAAVSPLEDIDARVEGFDWERVHGDLDIAGNAVLPGLLFPSFRSGPRSRPAPSASLW